MEDTKLLANSLEPNWLFRLAQLSQPKKKHLTRLDTKCAERAKRKLST